MWYMGMKRMPLALMRTAEECAILIFNRVTTEIRHICLGKNLAKWERKRERERACLPECQGLAMPDGRDSGRVTDKDVRICCVADGEELPLCRAW
jgi:hypothetical protein